MPADGPVRVVFDTNIIVSALIFGRRLAWLRGLWANGAVIPLVCRETAAELLRVLAYKKFNLAAGDQQALLADYLPFAEQITLPAALPALPRACRDRDDTVFLHLAIVAQADFLVSGDADLLTLNGAVPTRIIRIADLQPLFPAP